MNKNYKLIEKRHVSDVEGDVYYLEHIQSGARVLKIANNDSNKTFCITFKTQPDDDSGVAHVLEHSVLNGSKKYPVKSPFDLLIKGSLNTFLNAMTGSDVTMFPAASISEKDYFNLMDVYLDAVFNPLIYTDKRILKQEGWRIVANSKDEPFKYTGVVFNEMKGAYSDPQRELDRIISKTLFPSNCYGKSAGGYPSAITTLTQEHFTEFHKKYYHPGNSHIFLYGDADFDKELQMLSDGYLCHYGRSSENYDIPLQMPFDTIKNVSAEYMADEDKTPAQDTFLSLSVVTGQCDDMLTQKALDLISDALVNQESAPIRQKFLEQKIGADIVAFAEASQQPVLNFIGFNCDAAQAEQFSSIIYSELQKAASDGISKDVVEALLNRKEFYLREGNDAQQGLRKLGEILAPWIFGQNPIDLLESVKNFEQFKKAISEGLLERTIEKCLLGNSHAAKVTLTPNTRLEQETESKTQAALDAYKQSLSNEEIERLVEENRELDLYQNTPDPPEAIKCIPTLERADLNPKAEEFPVEIRKIGDTKVIYYDGFTNGIVYQSFFFNMLTLPFSLVPYGSLICELMRYMSTTSHDFGEIDTYLNNYAGGFSVANDIYNNIKEGKRIPHVEIKVQGKCLAKNLDRLADITIEIINGTIFSDKSRLRDLISRLASEADSDIIQRAFQYTRNRLDSYFNPTSYVDEYMSGIGYIEFIKDLNDNFDSKADEIIESLNKVRSLIFRADNMHCFAFCDSSIYPLYEKCAQKIIGSMSAEKSEYQEWNICPEPKDEALVKPSKIQYVLKGFDALSKDFEWSGHGCVVSKIISSDYLQNNVRVRGGAYGSWASLSYDGTAMLMSYRDPSLKATLDIYDKVWEYLENFNEDEDAMLKYIIGTISQKDSPLPTSQKGSLALSRYRTGRTQEAIQRERDEILSTTASDVRQYARLFKQLAENGSICVFGGEDIINENKNIFKSIIKL